MIKISVTYPSIEERPLLYRVKHDVEMGDLWRVLKPQVHPFFPNQYCDFDRAWQLRSREMNIRTDDQHWTQAYEYRTWMSNEQGFGDPDDPRRNYVTGEDMNYGLPRVEALTAGGNLVSGHPEGDWFVAVLLNYRLTPPPVDWMFAHPWFGVWGTVCGLNGRPIPLLQSKDSNGNIVPFMHPLIANTAAFPRIVIPMSKLQRWDAMEFPDPFRLYL